MKKIQALVLAVAILGAVSLPFSAYAKHKQLTRAELQTQVELLTTQVAALEARVQTLEGIKAPATGSGISTWKCDGRKGEGRKNCQKGG